MHWQNKIIEKDEFGGKDEVFSRIITRSSRYHWYLSDTGDYALFVRTENGGPIRIGRYKSINDGRASLRFFIALGNNADYNDEKLYESFEQASDRLAELDDESVKKGRGRRTDLQINVTTLDKIERDREYVWQG